MSNPAKTVNRLSGVDPFDNDIITPGLAFFAAQPQTEFTTIRVVPDLDKAFEQLKTEMNTSVHQGNLSDRIANAKKESLELETLIKELEQQQQMLQELNILCVLLYLQWMGMMQIHLILWHM